MQINPYLNFNGNCAEAFRFYEKVLRGKIEAIHTFGDSPMKNEMPPETPHNFQPAQGIYVSLNVDSMEEGKRIFDALAQGGQVTMPFEKTFWAPGFGMATDRFGTPWMVNVTHKP